MSVNKTPTKKSFKGEKKVLPSVDFFFIRQITRFDDVSSSDVNGTVN
jgi:hypothetical protein